MNGLEAKVTMLFEAHRAGRGNACVTAPEDREAAKEAIALIGSAALREMEESLDLLATLSPKSERTGLAMAAGALKNRADTIERGEAP